MTQRYQKHYAALGLTPGDNWQRARIAYKRAVRIWHPDRFAQNDPKQIEAEERTKTINQAFDELTVFFRAHGRLPFDNNPEPDLETPTADFSTDAPTSSAADTATNSATELDLSPTENRSHSPITMLLLLVAAFMAAYLFWRSPDSIDNPGTSITATTQPAPAPVTAPVLQETSQTNPPVGGTFTIGSSLGEVYAIQGVPSNIKGDTWCYQSACVSFSRGRVIAWEDPSGQVLKTRAGTEPELTVASGIARGSTKDDVLRVQGEPIRKTDQLWEYGASRIYFEQNRVTSWHNSPLQPLKLRN